MDNEMPEKIIPSSPNFQTELAKKIAEIVPEVISDGKIDITKLRELVNGDAETATEKFGLFWPGKARAQAVAQIPTSATLTPAPEESVDWDNTKNIFIEGDNLEVLKALQNSYRRKIKMIYIDPPYNTGKEFIYPDNFQEGLQSYLEYTGQKNEAGEDTESKKETGGRRHTNWLNMMYPRLQLAKSLLTNDGVIFISIDDNEQANLKKLCDEIYGEDNFINKFVWVSKPEGRQIQKSGAAGTHEFIFVYARDIQNINEFVAPNSYLSSLMPKTYGITSTDTKIDSKGMYIATHELYNGNAIFNEETRPSLVFDIYYRESDGEVKIEKVSNEHIHAGFIKIKPHTNSDGVHKYNAYRWSKDKIINEKEDLEFIKNGDTYKILTKRRDYDTTVVKDLITGITTRNGSKDVENLGVIGFDFPKPVSLINLFTKLQTANDDIILDFFSGSSTTAHAVMQLNAEDGGSRTHIQVQLPEPTDEKSVAYKAGYKTISDIGKERIRLAGKKIYAENAEKLKEREKPLDVGFRVYKLAPSNFIEWDEEKAKENIQQSILDFAENKKSDASPEALLAEIMLQNKITLDAKIDKKQLSSGGWVYVIDNGNLITYVDDKQITVDQAKEIADMAPGKLVIIDSAFNGNDALKINIANICKEKFIKEFKTI